MSQVMTVSTKVNDINLAKEVSEQMGLQTRVGTHEISLYSGQKAQADLSFKLKGWNYPVAIRKDGTMSFDNFNGSWGKQAELDRFLQNYSAEKTRREIRGRGLMIESETVNEEGEIELLVGVSS